MPEPQSYIREVRELTDLQAKLIAAIEDLIEAYEGFIASVPGGGEVMVSAGPFRSMDGVRAFERQLSELSSVHEVEIRGYEGDDRAIFRVELEPSHRQTP
jgi:hypothetical protein